MVKRLFLLLALAAWSQNSSAQIIIEASDFNLSTLDDIYGIDSMAGIAPQFGTGKNWNFGNLKIDGRDTIVNDTAQDLFFPNAFRYQETTVGLDTFFANAKFYQKKDTSLFKEVGISVTAKTYDLFSVTGAANDSIRILNGKSRMDAHLLKFPVKFNDNWTTSYRTVMPFILTVQALSHLNVPYTLVSNTQDVSIVRGTGVLSLPDGKGSTRQMNATLIQRAVFSYDSIYQGANPASPIILGAMGISQGQRRTDLTYSFYVKGSNQPQLILTIDTATNRLLRSKFYLESTTGIKSFEENKLPIAVYPNPNNTGAIQLKSVALAYSNCTVSVFDIKGSLIFEKGLRQTNSQETSIDLESIPNGEYLLLLKNDLGVLTWSKLIISK